MDAIDHEMMKFLNIFLLLGWQASSVLRGGWGQYLKPFPIKLVPVCWKEDSGRLSNLTFGRSNALCSCKDPAGFVGVCTSNHAWTHVGLEKVYDHISLVVLWVCTIGIYVIGPLLWVIQSCIVEVRVVCIVNINPSALLMWNRLRRLFDWVQSFHFADLRIPLLNANNVALLSCCFRFTSLSLTQACPMPLCGGSLEHPTGRRSWGRSRTCRRDWISHLASESLRILQEELEDMTGKKDVLASHWPASGSKQTDGMDITNLWEGIDALAC